jgi:FkbM family methyltransferase
MKILGRDLTTYAKNLRHTHRYVWYLIRCCWLFKHPWQLFYAYLTQTKPASHVIELRSGLKIFLSQQPQDAVTVFLIFVREDYGKVPPHSTVIDIGANIGVFSLYAIHQQAAKVYAYEPNSEAYQCLQRNIIENHLEGRIIPQPLAVCHLEAGVVKFPKQSSIFNAILTDKSTQDFDWAPTTTLDAIMRSVGAAQLVKLDCEGAEYDILFNASAQTLRQIEAFKMECHAGRAHELKSFLQSYGFVCNYFRADNLLTSCVWFVR